MLSFFRRFQKGIFIGITVVIVMSFSFFGTYNLFDKQVKDEVAFTAIDGTQVNRSEVDAMAHFLASDSIDQMNWGVPLGANFLNDGVVRYDFLKNGLAEVLFQGFYPELKGEWEGKWKRERAYQGYKHPEVAYFSADAVWSHFAPQLKEALKNYKTSNLEQPTDQFAKKVALYLAEGEFSEQKLRQVLYFQLQQAKWIKPDRNLQNQNLALFGYRTLSDWFGQEFLRLTASFILNASKVAQKEGYQVSLDEALFDLKKKALIAFESQRQNPMMTLSDPNQYLREQLRYLGMDLNQAAETWQKVLLFRKMFNDLGSSVVVDKETLTPFVDYAGEQIEVATYRLAKENQIKDFRQLQRFETYLQAVSKESGDTLPTQWKREDELLETAPELLMKRYLVDVKEIDHRDVVKNISLKSLWNWQVSDKGWEKLTKEFSELSLAMAMDEESRFVALDQLDQSTKERVDHQSKLFITAEHPEWVEEAIAQAPLERKTFVFYRKGSKNPLKGISNPEKVVTMLDQVDLDSQIFVTLRDLGDKTFQVRVFDRSPDWEIATFAEADREGVLEEMTVALLQKKHEELKETSSSFDKPFNDVRDAVAQEFFRKQINQVKRSLPEGVTSQAIDLVSSYRMKAYLTSLRDLEEESFVISTRPELENKLDPRPFLNEQFKVIKDEVVWDRLQNGAGQSFSTLLTKKGAEVSDVIRQSNGELYFYRVLGAKNQVKEELVASMIQEVKSQLSASLQMELAKRLLLEFKEKGAIKQVSLKGQEDNVV